MGAPATVTAEGQHNITVPYAGEATARGDYPAAAKAIAAKHAVPLVDITTWSKTMVEAHAAAGTLDYVYIASDQTHVRELGAMLMAQEAVRALNAQGVLSGYPKTPGARVMLDAGSIAFGGLYAGNTLDKSMFRGHSQSRRQLAIAYPRMEQSTIHRQRLPAIPLTRGAS